MSIRTLWARFRVNSEELAQLKAKAAPLTVSQWLRSLAGLESVEYKFGANGKPVKRGGGGWPKGKPRPKKIVKGENSD